MRPVARIAQSVEQGIENPRVLGSIPSPGTTYLHQSTLVKSEILNGRLTQGSVIESFSAQIAFNKLHCLTKN